MTSTGMKICSTSLMWSPRRTPIVSQYTRGRLGCRVSAPKENRNIPPLRYDDVYRLKRERPHLCVEINGGIRTIDDMAQHLGHVDAVMIGRAVYENPMLFADVDRRFYDDSDVDPVERVLCRRADASIRRSLA